MTISLDKGWVIEREGAPIVQVYRSAERDAQFCIAVRDIGGEGPWSLAYVTEEELRALAQGIEGL